MDDDAIPKRSGNALAALDIFYDEFNDVHFFVEDEDQENLYEVILRRMFPDLRLTRIFPLGGKAAVLDHSSRNAGETAQRSVYLVDKDFDDFLGARIQRPRLFYLERYCIENYFAEADAIVEVVVESLPKLSRIDIAAALDMQIKLVEFAESMRPLFQLFYCVQRFNLGIKNCSLSVERFCSTNRRWLVDPGAIASYAQQVVTAASNTQYAAALLEPLTHPEVAALSSMDHNSVVSGKHVCALVFHYLKSRYNIGTITFESFMFRLAKNSAMHSLQSLGEQIRASLDGPLLLQTH